MDRFIDNLINIINGTNTDLKSNMDRFIAVAAYTEKEKFKV